MSSRNNVHSKVIELDTITTAIKGECMKQHIIDQANEFAHRVVEVIQRYEHNADQTWLSHGGVEMTGSAVWVHHTTRGLTVELHNGKRVIWPCSQMVARRVIELLLVGTEGSC